MRRITGLMLCLLGVHHWDVLDADYRLMQEATLRVWRCRTCGRYRHRGL